MVVKEPESNFIPAPAGAHSAVCVDEIDLGYLPNHFDPESDDVLTVRLVWQIAEDMKDGKPFLIKKDYRASLHERAGLRKDLESWRGQPFTSAELVGFDLENIVGAPCMLSVIHKTGSKGGTFANVASIMPLPKGMAKLTPRDYVRMKDRPQDAPKPKAKPQWGNDDRGVVAPEGITDDDVPF
jgi:hypothetical protein